MGKEMDKLRGMALANRAKAMAEEDVSTSRAVGPVIPGSKLPGAAPGGQIRSHVTLVGRARRGLMADMLKHMEPETLAKLDPGQRAAVAQAVKWDNGGE